MQHACPLHRPRPFSLITLQMKKCMPSSAPVPHCHAQHLPDVAIAQRNPRLALASISAIASPTAPRSFLLEAHAASHLNSQSHEASPSHPTSQSSAQHNSQGRVMITRPRTTRRENDTMRLQQSRTYRLDRDVLRACHVPYRYLPIPISMHVTSVLQPLAAHRWLSGLWGACPPPEMPAERVWRKVYFDCSPASMLVMVTWFIDLFWLCARRRGHVS
jgi:hypothetical protein